MVQKLKIDMKYQLTYNEFFKNRLAEATDYDKITTLQNRIRTLTDQLNHESDFDKKQKLQKDIKVCELKLMVARMEQSDKKAA